MILPLDDFVVIAYIYFIGNVIDMTCCVYAKETGNLPGTFSIYNDQVPVNDTMNTV
jgi:hypothetical protein